MVGRGMELARLQRALAADETQVVLVSGEAGVGKTRLLRELAATLPVGARVLAGQASQGVPARPFQLLLEAIGPSVSTWRQVPQRLADREEPLRLLLRPILGHLEPFTDREYSQEELLGAAVALVEDLLIGTGRGVLVFEDLHWADAQSVALFGRRALTPGISARSPRWPLTGWTSTPSPSCWPRSTGTRCRSGSPRRCTDAPVATRSSSRSCWSPPATPTRRSSAWSRPRPCSASASPSTCSPR